MDNKLIIFGPWVGEFSYEISWWIPEIREIKNKKYSNYITIAVGSKGKKALYKDFIDEYITFPHELEELIKYPSGAGQHINGSDIIPFEFTDFINYIKNYYKKEFNDIIIISPDPLSFGWERVLADNPIGEYIHYKIDLDVESKVKKDISDYFNNDKNTIAIMARSRYRNGSIDPEDWNPKNWEELIKKIIQKLDVNIVLIGINNKYNRGGSLNLDKINLEDKYKNNILYYDLNDDDSIEKQFAILKNTKCSIYGGTGAATLPFFLNTPVFTQQTRENGFRLKFEWQKKLTNNHEYVEIFDKYSKGEIYNSPVEEFLNKFTQFYKQINKNI